MDNYWVDISLILVVGIAGIYTSYLVSPYISKGLEVVSEQVITLPLPEEKETTKFVFFALSYLVVIQMITSLVDVSFDYSFINIEPIIPVVNEIVNEVTRYTPLLDSIENDKIFLNGLQPVTTFLSDSNSVKSISVCLLKKLFNSTLIFYPQEFKIHYDAYVQNKDVIALLTNHELLRTAPILRIYYLSSVLGLKIDYNALTALCKLPSDEHMILQLIETNLRYGSSMGGVSSYELILRNAVISQCFELNPDMFMAKFIRIDGVLTLVYNETSPVFFTDGSIEPYRWNTTTYGPMDIEATKVQSIIGKDKVIKALWFICYLINNFS